MKQNYRVKSMRDHKSRYGNEVKVVYLEHYDPYLECKNKCGSSRKPGSAYCPDCSEKYLLKTIQN